MSKATTTKELRSFYVGRAKNPALFDYDDDGNMIEKDKSGATVRTIAALPVYRKPTVEEVDEMEEKHKEAIAEASRVYEDARTQLYQAHQEELLKNPDERDKKRLLILNRQVTEADEALQLVRYPLRKVNKEDKVEIRSLEFDKTHEVRKYPYEIALFTTRPFTLQDQYVRVGEEPKAPLVTVSEAKQKEMLESKQPVILFDGNEDAGAYGFLSLNWPVHLEFNQSVYHSAKQAVAAEMAKRMGDATQLQRIMITQSPAEVTYSIDNVNGDPMEKEVKWNTEMNAVLHDVHLEKFRQFPELAARLLATQQAVLGAYFPNDNRMGIGISIDRPQAKLQSNWTGQNEMGKALMRVRDELRAMQPPAEAAPTEIKVPRKKKPVAATASASTIPVAPVASSAAASAAPAEFSQQEIRVPIRKKKTAVVVPPPSE